MDNKLTYVYMVVAAVGMVFGIARFFRQELSADEPRRPVPPPMPTAVKVQVPRVTRDDVERVIRREYAPEQWDTVISLLDEYGDSERNRVSLAILKLSGGDIDQLRDNVKLANLDYRDVISPAESPRSSSDWSRGTSPEEHAALQRDVAEDWREYQEWLHAE